MIPIKSESAWRGISDCRTCGLRDIMLFADLNAQDMDQIHAPIDDLLYPAGEMIYSEGAPVAGVLKIRHGSIKLQRVTQDGRERIIRVLRAGDVVGLEALAGSVYDSAAVALTEVSVCRIPVSVIEALDRNSPRMHKRLMEKWQRALREADDWLAELNCGSARQRVASFIQKMRNPDDAQVAILYSREDMGAMLDLKLETVSREISALVRSGAMAPIDRLGRMYRVLNEEAIQQA